MQLLLDTHALLWWLAGDEALSAPARAAIADEDNRVLVSAASLWEITTKYRLGKLPGVITIVSDLSGAVAGQGFIGLPISLRHGQLAGALPGPHRDPFDRMLIAQAILDDLVLCLHRAPLRRLRRRQALVRDRAAQLVLDMNADDVVEPRFGLEAQFERPRRVETPAPSR